MTRSKTIEREREREKKKKEKRKTLERKETVKLCVCVSQYQGICVHFASSKPAPTKPILAFSSQPGGGGRDRCIV